MSEPKWTKGPWRIVGDDEKEGGIPFVDIEAGESGTTSCKAICEVSSTLLEDGPDFDDDFEFALTPEDRANAHLIASAPSLFEVLAKIERDWDGEPEDMEEARAALRKARGEQS